jgi:hypothetical protein
MQRRLTDGEAERIARAYDALLGFPPKLDRPATHDCRMLLQDMLTHNTTDGLPYVDPPLTDEDARARPWVMVRDADTNPWNGPFIFICKTKERWGFAVTQPDFCELQSFCYARRATPEEIAAAGLTTPDA